MTWPVSMLLTSRWCWGRVRWPLGDISKAFPDAIPQADYLIDLAALHFLVHEDSIVGYLDSLRSIVVWGGYALL